MKILLTTENLILREFTSGDAEEMAAFASDDRITQWLPDWLDCHEWITPWLENVQKHYVLDQPLEKFLAYAIIDKASGKIAGHLGCGDFEGTELGVCYVANPEFGGQGLITEAMKAFSEYLLERYAIDYLIATIQPDNLPSIRVAEKTGFVYQRTIEIVDNGQTEKLPFRYYRKYRK